MASAPAVVTPPPLGSTRLMHVWSDWSQANNIPNNNLGPGQGTPWALDRANQSSTSPARGGAWTNLSGVNKQAGRMMTFLQATSFNIGSFSNYIIPIVGGNAAAAATLPVAENAQYYAWNFILALGSGIAQSGFTPILPPFAGVQCDVGVFFFPADFGLSSSSYQQFSDNNGNGAEQGFAFFQGNDGLWHYGIRYNRVLSPLDVDVPLPAGAGVAQWPVPLVGGVGDYAQYVQLTLEFIAATGAGDSLFRASLNGKQLLQTSFAKVGAAPVGAGLTSQLPDFYSESSLNFGIVGVVRAGPGTGAGNVTGTIVTNGVQASGSPTLSLAITTPGGTFQPSDRLTIAGQVFTVTATVAAAAITTVSVSPNVGAAIPDATPVTYSARGQIFPVCFNQMEYTSGPNLPSTFPSM